MEKRVIAFDIGNRRIGVAISDPFNSYAMPLETYFRGQSAREDARALARLAEEEGAGRIVCGLPLFADGTKSDQTEATRKFIELLKAETSLPVSEADERYTTCLAHGDLRQMGVSAKRDKGKKRVDSLAAAYILESFLALQKEETMSLKEDNNDYEEDENLVELVDEDGNRSNYEHLMTFEYKKEWYVALTPVGDAEEEDEEAELEDDDGDEIAIYHLVGGEDDEHLEAIDDEDLLDELFDEFCRLYEDSEEDEEE